MDLLWTQCPLAHSLYYDCRNDCCGATLTRGGDGTLIEAVPRVLTNPSTSKVRAP